MNTSILQAHTLSMFQHAWLAIAATSPYRAKIGHRQKKYMAPVAIKLIRMSIGDPMSIGRSTCASANASETTKKTLDKEVHEDPDAGRPANDGFDAGGLVRRQELKLVLLLRTRGCYDRAKAEMLLHQMPLAYNVVRSATQWPRMVLHSNASGRRHDVRAREAQ